MHPLNSNNSNSNNNSNNNSNSENINTLKLLTFNVGLLDFTFFGLFTLFSNPSYVSKRYSYIPSKLKEINADIIAIQECYTLFHSNYIINSLSDIYPYHIRYNNDNSYLTPWKFHNGLLFLSKYPIISSHIERLNKAASLEMWMANKSNLVITVSIPSLGSITLVNTHTTAGGATHPEHPGVDSDREDELRQAVNSLKIVDNYCGGIIIGDLNCGPEASAANYEFLVKENNFRDTYLEAEENNRLLPGPKYSWDPENYLNQIGPHADCPGQRCDHILLQRGYDLDNWVVESAQLVFSERFIDIGKDNILSTLSDHHGVVVTLTKSSHAQHLQSNQFNSLQEKKQNDSI